MIFAIGYAERRNPVSVSRQGDLPDIGSPEADQYFTGDKLSAGETLPKKRFGLGHQGEKEKNEPAQHIN